MHAATLSPPLVDIGPPPQRVAQPIAHPDPCPDAGTDAGSARPAKPSPLRGDLLLYLLLTLLVAAAWAIGQMQLFKANDDTSYWIAVSGGSMMLLLFTYPLRKHFRFMQHLGTVKWWFWVHLFLGIAGPWLILVHSGFHIGSLNAGVALYSMVVVVLSGVVGRFIHVRVHRGLNGELTTLQALRARAGMVESEARSRLHFCPAAEARLLAFEEHELRASVGWLTYLRQLAWLPVQQHVVAWRCRSELRAALALAGQQGRWSPEERRRRDRRARRLVDRYLNAVVRVAQFTAYERAFSLWHVAHVPFVYLLVISAVVHVVAVHAY
jgi:hypothetical protein